MLQATSARLLWNAKGTAVLAITASETDASNKSYYGEQKLHFLAANGTNDCLVPLPKVRFRILPLPAYVFRSHIFLSNQAHE